MSEDHRINHQQAEHANDEINDLLDGIGDRIDETVESIADLAEAVEGLNGEITSLLDDLRIIQNKVEPEYRDKLEPLIDQLESVSRELQTAQWTMDCTSEDFLEDTDLEELFEQQIDSFA
jgi:archaellum component FlaC